MLIFLTFYVIISLVTKHRYRVICSHYCAISPYPSASHAVLTQTRINNATLSPLSTRSTAFTLSLTVYAFRLRLNMMLRYCCSDQRPWRRARHGML